MHVFAQTTALVQTLCPTQGPPRRLRPAADPAEPGGPRGRAGAGRLQQGAPSDRGRATRAGAGGAGDPQGASWPRGGGPGGSRWPRPRGEPGAGPVAPGKRPGTQAGVWALGVRRERPPPHRARRGSNFAARVFLARTGGAARLLRQKCGEKGTGVPMAISSASSQLDL